MVFGPVVTVGAEVWMSWSVDHGFGLADSPELVTAEAGV
jgi:spermidine/putrescine transport system ATP-binding protein